MEWSENKQRNSSKGCGRSLAWALAGILLLAVLVFLAVGPAHSPVQPPLDETLPPPETNPYGPEDFIFRDGYLTCTAGESRLGVDVSEHQEEIDWVQVREAGVEFAMIRLGYRGYEEGQLHVDEYALENLRGAREAGLSIGAYFFSQAVTPREAKAEAQLALQLLDGMALDFPLVYDWEYVAQDARTSGLDSRTLTDCVIAFCDTVAAAGYRPMVYFNQDLSDWMLRLEELTDYAFWLAMYDTEMTYPYRVDMWQYTAEGAVPGIAGDVDLNLYFPS